jgi:hypothetical protein
LLKRPGFTAILVPTLDSTNGEAVMELLRELHGGGATILRGDA